MKPKEGDNVIISPDTQRDQRVPPGQRLTQHWPVLHAGKIPELDRETWRFRIFGMVEKEELTKVEFMEKDRPGFWEEYGYHMHGDPWKEERFGGR
jgi:DMSO/TMAO reductase YedYZ molybdopterin-dependent catalytic subunit